MESILRLVRTAVAACAVGGDVDRGRLGALVIFIDRLFADAFGHRHRRRFRLTLRPRLWRDRRRAGFGAAYGLDFGGYITAPDSDFNREREVFAASGIAGGLVYWLFAGRKAGAWK